MKPPTLRIARPTDRLAALAEAYKRGLGFEELGRFDDHSGFDGIMLGHPEHSYHLEFTHERGVPAPSGASGEYLLVFYIPGKAEWNAACERLLAAGFEPILSHNPYWDTVGRTFADLDGYRVVLACQEWAA